MGTFDALLVWFGLKKVAVLGSAFGSASALYFLKDVVGVAKKAGAFCVGWSGGAWGAPVILELLGFEDRHTGTAGFFVGVLFIAVVGNVILAVPEWMAALRAKFLGEKT